MITIANEANAVSGAEKRAGGDILSVNLSSGAVSNSDTGSYPTSYENDVRVTIPEHTETKTIAANTGGVQQDLGQHHNIKTIARSGKSGSITKSTLGSGDYGTANNIRYVTTSNIQAIPSATWLPSIHLGNLGTHDLINYRYINAAGAFNAGHLSRSCCVSYGTHNNQRGGWTKYSVTTPGVYMMLYIYHVSMTGGKYSGDSASNRKLLPFIAGNFGTLDEGGVSTSWTKYLYGHHDYGNYYNPTSNSSSYGGKNNNCLVVPTTSAIADLTGDTNQQFYVANTSYGHYTEIPYSYYNEVLFPALEWSNGWCPRYDAGDMAACYVLIELYPGDTIWYGSCVSTYHPNCKNPTVSYTTYIDNGSGTLIPESGSTTSEYLIYMAPTSGPFIENRTPNTTTSHAYATNNQVAYSFIKNDSIGNGSGTSDVSWQTGYGSYLVMSYARGNALSAAVNAAEYSVKTSIEASEVDSLSGYFHPVAYCGSYDARANMQYKQGWPSHYYNIRLAATTGTVNSRGLSMHRVYQAYVNDGRRKIIPHSVLTSKNGL